MRGGCQVVGGGCPLGGVEGCSSLFRRCGRSVSVGAASASQFRWGPQWTRDRLELAGAVLGWRGWGALKGSFRESTCQAAIRTLRATSALAGFALPVLVLMSR